ncbi:MAG: cation:proton antiporter [Bacteroidetes bacterium]|nr:cation:proton antiporter [Bacteroidota bacterium]
MSLNLVLIIIIFGGWLSGRLFSHIHLPAVLGMVLFGIAAGILVGNRIPGILWELEPFLKSFALIAILLRAGLGINRKTLQQTGRTTILMALIPCLFEGTALTVALHYFFGFAWSIAGLTAFMLSAVSLAVIVPSMLDLKDRGIGRKNEVPTILLAGTSVDNVFAITIFTIFLGLSTGGETPLLRSLLFIPISIAAGVISGILFGVLLLIIFKKNHKNMRATEKLLILLAAAILLVQVGDWLQYAALIGVMTLGFVILERSPPIAHELSLKLSKIWIFAEITLFVLIGLSVDPAAAAVAGLKGIGIILGGLFFRGLGVLLATVKSGLTFREKVFCVIAYIPKATVQAALGSVALAYGIPEGNTILALAVLAILITAPLGLIGIRLTAHKLLGVDIE